MKFYPTLLLLAFSVITFKSQSQDFSFAFQKPSKELGIIQKIYPLADKGLVLTTKFRSDENEVYVQLVNYKLEVLKETKLSILNVKFYKPIGIYKVNNKLYAIYSHRAKKYDHDFTLTAIEVDPVSLTVGTNITLKTVAYSSSMFATEPEYELRSSLDSNRLFLSIEFPQKSNDEKEIFYAVFNKEMKQEYEKTITLSAENDKVVVQNTWLDNDGNILLHYRTYEKPFLFSSLAWDETHKRSQYQTHLKLYGRNPASDIKIALNGLIHNVAFVNAPTSGKTTIMGTYSKGAHTQLEGIYSGSYEPSNTSITPTTYLFPKDIMDRLDEEEKDKKEDGISRNFKSKRISFRPNGSLDYMLEFDRRIPQAKSSGEGYDIIHTMSIINININGQNPTFTLIPRSARDVYFNDMVTSNAFYKENKLIVLYNDDKDNVAKPLTEPAKLIVEPGKKSVLVAAIIDESGNLTRKVVYDHSDKYVSKLSLAKPLLDGGMLIIKNDAEQRLDYGKNQFGYLFLK